MLNLSAVEKIKLKTEIYEELNKYNDPYIIESEQFIFELRHYLKYVMQLTEEQILGIFKTDLNYLSFEINSPAYLLLQRIVSQGKINFKINKYLKKYKTNPAQKDKNTATKAKPTIKNKVKERIKNKVKVQIKNKLCEGDEELLAIKKKKAYEYWRRYRNLNPKRRKYVNEYNRRFYQERVKNNPNREEAMRFARSMFNVGGNIKVKHVFKRRDKASWILEENDISATEYKKMKSKIKIKGGYVE